MSHSEMDFVDAFIEWTKDTYEDVKKRKPSRGNIYDHPAMTLDYTTQGEVKLYMKEYIYKINE